MSQVVENIIAQLMSEAKEVAVAQVQIGIIYTAVQLTNGRCGVALTTPAIDGSFSHTCFAKQRPLIGRRADELLVGLKSEDRIEATVGLATANALANIDSQNYHAGDFRQILSLSPQDHVAMVGYFRPMIADIEASKARLSIFELNPGDNTRLLSPEKMKEIIPQCTVAIITAATLINHTLDDILSMTHHCRDVLLAGASSPLRPSLFVQTPLTVLAGISINDPARVLQIIAEGGGRKFFNPFITKRYLRLN